LTKNGKQIAIVALPVQAGGMKNASFLARFGYALAGIGIVWRREKSFRTQCLLGLGAMLATAALRPGLLWSALVAVSIALVLAFEMINAALEYLIDRVHPEIADEIKFAKDAAAGAVLLASLCSLIVGAMMLLSVFGP
jgi:undecaprenol kinase